MILGVFFPSLMGVGILASGALLVADQVRKLIPNRGIRRQHRVATGAFGVVAAAAGAAGRRVARSDLLDREPRSAVAYAAISSVVAAVGLAVVLSCRSAYLDPIGPFHDSPWMIGIGWAAGIASGALALVATALAMTRSNPPGLLSRIVRSTGFGRLRVTDDVRVTTYGEEPTKERT
jgi:hypothetical protein